MDRSKQFDARMAEEPGRSAGNSAVLETFGAVFPLSAALGTLALAMVFLSLAAGGVVLSMPLLSVVIVLGLAGVYPLRQQDARPDVARMPDP